ncbi:MAG: hypothetical protein LBR37_03865 [Erysipelotrichaceae bacterium]|jgi:membrane protease YdiL (CAAX protease family)|nr:hypothetical protein [Erysipelotrichaceae bacterium]
MRKNYFELEDGRKQRKSLIFIAAMSYVLFIVATVMAVWFYVFPSDLHLESGLIIGALMALILAIVVTWALKVKLYKYFLLITESGVEFMEKGHSEKYLFQS